MKILLAGPKVCTPWTEGRKRFMRDLAAALGRQHDVRVVTTVEKGEQTQFAAPWDAPAATGGVQHLWRFHRQLRRVLDQWRPDFVCHMPIGSFHGRYRYGNMGSMWLADLQCASRRVPCLTLMYAIMSETSLQQLARRVRCLLVNPYAGGERSVRFGVDLPRIASPAVRTFGRRLLFMAGMSETTPERLEHVLTVRGLTTLLSAGEWLAPYGFKLTVAVPLLRDSRLRLALRELPQNRWPKENLDIQELVSVPDIYSEHDIFVFPYGRNEPQFIPTSVIEAMHWGLPTALPAHPFLSPLIRDEETALVYWPNDARDLASVLLDAVNGGDRLNAIAVNAYHLVQGEFHIKGTCEDLLLHYEQIKAARHSHGNIEPT